MALAIAACGAPGTTEPASTSATGGGAATAPVTTAAASEPSSASTAPSANLCAGLAAKASGRVADSGLSELSGLVASQRHPGVLWAHNDSGHPAAVFALGLDGKSQGEMRLAGVDQVDTEDIALAGDQLYLADIGDNDERRADIALYRFPEPEPGSPGRRTVSGVETLRFRYPDRAHDAEALLVDPVSGQVVVITKDIGFGTGGNRLIGAAPARIFVADPPFAAGQVATLQAAGTLAADQLDRRATAVPAPGRAADNGLGGLVTGADISADGRVIAIRTYATIWLFDRPAGSTVAQALTGTPCEAPSRPEVQGEAIAILPGPSLRLVTAGEGSRTELTVVSR